jgi:hypothetical protein
MGNCCGENKKIDSNELTTPYKPQITESVKSVDGDIKLATVLLIQRNFRGWLDRKKVKKIRY